MAKFTSFEQFADFTLNLIRMISAKGDERGLNDQATIKQLSSDLSVANSKIQELVTALEAKDMALTTAIANEQTALLGKLDTLSTELELSFNPNSTSDAVAEVVATLTEQPDVAADPAIGTSNPTGPEVVEGAVAAVEVEIELDTRIQKPVQS